MEYVTFWLCGFVYICGAYSDGTVFQSKENTSMTIGAIANGKPAIKKTVYSKYGRNVTIVWHYVDTSEIYHIFRTIRILDEQPNVDLIMMFDYSPTILRNPQLLQTTHKQLIKWGHKVQPDELYQLGGEAGRLNTADLCGDEKIPDLLFEDIYCQTYLNASHSVPVLSKSTNVIFDKFGLGSEPAILSDGIYFGSVYILTQLGIDNELHHRIPSVLARHQYIMAAIDNSIYTGQGSIMRNLRSTKWNSNLMSESITLIAPGAMTSLVKTLSWRSLTILHENATEHEASELVDHLSNNNILFTVFNVDIVKDLHTLFYKLYLLSVPTKQHMNVVVLCRFFCATNIFKVANQFDTQKNPKKTLLQKFSRWLVAVYGHSKGVSRALQACADDLDNVAIIAIPEFSGAGSKDFYDILGNIMQELQSQQLNRATENVTHLITNVLSNKSALWNPAARCTGYHIDTLLWTADGRKFSSVGHMHATGYVVIETDLFPNTKYGYNKRQFLVSTLPYEPFTYKKLVNGTAIYEGFIMDLLEQLAYSLNFTYTMTEPDDGLWGSLVNNSQTVFNGLVGQLQREEVDMVAASLSTESNRERAMDFTYPFYYEYTTIITKKPDVNKTKWRTLLDPFKWHVLLFIGIAIPLVTTLVFLLEKYNPFYKVPDHAASRDNSGGLHSWANSFWYMYGALLSQGGVHLPDSTSGRTLVSFWWMFCIIVVGTYSGNLIAFLTVSKEKAPFNTIDELVELKDDYKWGTLGGSIWEVVFSKSNSGTYKEMAEGLREFNKSDPTILHSDPNFHIQRVRQGGYAFISEKTLSDISVTRFCDLIIMKETFMPLNNAFGFPDKSPHTQIFSEQMMKLHEGGLFQVLKRKWWPKANFCTPQSTTEAKPISLVDVQSAFYVCFIGIFLGFIAFLIEICLNRIIIYRNQTSNTNVEINSTNLSQSETGKAVPGLK